MLNPHIPVRSCYLHQQNHTFFCFVASHLIESDESIRITVWSKFFCEKDFNQFWNCSIKDCFVDFSIVVSCSKWGFEIRVPSFKLFRNNMKLISLHKLYSFESKLFYNSLSDNRMLNTSNIKADTNAIPAPQAQVIKKVNPKVFKAMQNYEKLKKQLIDHFFEGQPLNIPNKQFSFAYTDLYDLLNDSSFVIESGKQKFESIEQSFLDIYKNDLKMFAGRIFEIFQKSRGLHPEDEIMEIAKWINIYARFNHWIFKMFMIIQRNAMLAQGIKLYFEGIKILKEVIFEVLYDDLYHIVYQTLDLYKRDLLKSYESLQLVIRYIGIIGFSKFKLVEMVKTKDERFEYQSKKDNTQPSENPYCTDYFKINFLSRLVKDLKNKYTDIVNGMIQLSTPQYFEKARLFIQKQEDTADLFYGHPTVKETVIRYVLETLIVENAETLLTNPKSGMAQMMQQKDVRNLVKIFELLKKSNMQRVFFKEFQNYIRIEGEHILTRAGVEEEKNVKKDAIQIVLKEIIEFNQLIDTIRMKIDIDDADLQKAQNSGFQSFCNVGNRVCNYLASYADLMLKKQAGYSNGEDIVTQVGKISKYLYSYDYFMNTYQKLLGLRILYDSFKNEEAEFALINMLKTEAGINATSKISNMIQDQKSSEAWNTEFQLKNKFGFGMDVMMCTSGSWEINDPKCGKTHVPPELMPAVEQFEAKFLEKMPNRSVSWIFTHGRAIIQFIPNSNVKHILIVNNYQLLTLLYLKRHGYVPIKYNELLSELKIQDQSFFKSSMLSMLKNGVLVKEGVPVKIDSKTDELKINLDFKHKNIKVSCSITPKISQKTGTTSAPVSAERCILIDAALVKIMKQRRRAPYQEVILEVQKMCRTFKAEISQIKLRIENCQQREFLERDPNDMNILIYKP